jgi:hypothetical protein
MVTRLVVVLILPVVVSFAAFNGARALVDSPAQESDKRPTGLAWADRVFVSPSTFAAFLRARGADYETWARRHPAGAPWGPRPKQAAASKPKVDVRDERSNGSRAIEVATSLLPIGLVLGTAVIALLVAVRLGRAAYARVPASPRRKREPVLSAPAGHRQQNRPSARAGSVVVIGEGLRRAPAMLAARTASHVRRLREETGVTRFDAVTYGLGALGGGVVGILVAYMATQ